MTYQCQRGPANNSVTNAGSWDDYLQLRKDAMRIPKQFFFHHKVPGQSDDIDNYFSFNAATEEAKDES